MGCPKCKAPPSSGCVALSSHMYISPTRKASPGLGFQSFYYTDMINQIIDHKLSLQLSPFPWRSGCYHPAQAPIFMNGQPPS